MTARILAPDTDADLTLRSILDQDRLIGFRVVAGAGSGKTTSLVKALAYVTKTRGPTLSAKSQQIACITYTEVAAREIHEEIGNDPLASVSTIHSFLWSLVRPFQKDIATWVVTRIKEQIADLEHQQENFTSRTRETTKANIAADMEKRKRQLAAVPAIRRWNYGIGGDYSRGQLGHTDILKMVPAMILEHDLLARIVAQQFPFIFVDESQDTNPEVVRCLKQICALADGKMCLGFFGDHMQRIYLDGVGPVPLEPGWRNIDKPENFRSSRRVLACVNAVRAQDDAVQQVTGLGSSQPEGHAICVILPADDNRTEALERVREWLDQRSAAGNWTRSAADGGSKILMIVHRMAARRLGFDALFAAFSDNGSDSLKEAFGEGNPWPLTPFRDAIIPLCQNTGRTTAASLLAILKDQSPLLATGREQRQVRSALAACRSAVEELRDATRPGGDATLGQLLRLVGDRNLIELDPRLAAYLYPDGTHNDLILGQNTTRVLDAMSECRFDELAGYYTYVNQESPYSTQHGTKGAEFDRVLVVLDDEEGKFHQYSYDKLLGIKPPSKTDLENQAEGKDSAIERTRRLFYVCVSRARQSLAVVLFAKDVTKAVNAVNQSAIGGHLDLFTTEDLT